MIFIDLVEEPIEVDKMLALVSCEKAGAICSFLGVTRKDGDTENTQHLYYEAYRSMALRTLDKIAKKALQDFNTEKIAIVHRIGKVALKETSIFIAVSTAHRKQSFLSCQFIIDTIKTDVPIWKKEFTSDINFVWK